MEVLILLCEGQSTDAKAAPRSPAPQILECIKRACAKGAEIMKIKGAV